VRQPDVEPGIILSAFTRPTPATSIEILKVRRRRDNPDVPSFELIGSDQREVISHKYGPGWICPDEQSHSYYETYLPVHAACLGIAYHVMVYNVRHGIRRGIKHLGELWDDLIRSLADSPGNIFCKSCKHRDEAHEDEVGLEVCVREYFHSAELGN